MMEIKVRAWDNHEKRWAKTHEIEGELFINPEADDTGVFYIHDKSASGKLHYTLVRSTGLRDKHGKEIWEGNRITGTATDVDGHRHAITGTIEWDKDECGFVVLSDTDKWPVVAMRFMADLEVIGSIYGEGA